MCTTSIGFKDPSVKEGELLWLQRCPIALVSEIKKDIGYRPGIAAQLQQHPVPHSGALFKKDAITLRTPPKNTEGHYKQGLHLQRNRFFLYSRAGVGLGTGRDK